MKPEGSLPHLQEPVTCPYPEPYQSSACSPILEDSANHLVHQVKYAVLLDKMYVYYVYILLREYSLKSINI
jgi:hypothetical protein